MPSGRSKTKRLLKTLALALGATVAMMIAPSALEPENGLPTTSTVTSTVSRSSVRAVRRGQSGKGTKEVKVERERTVRRSREVRASTASEGTGDVMTRLAECIADMMFSVATSAHRTEAVQRVLQCAAGE